MNIRFLRAFLAVARHANISRAAQELNLAQSSVSDQIRALEDEAGAKLFDRGNAGLVPTQAGHALMQYAEEIVALEREAKATLSAMSGSAPITVGCLPALAAPRLAPFLSSSVSDSHSEPFRLQVDGTPGLIQKLLQGVIDVAFCFPTAELDERLVGRAIIRERLALIAPAAHGGNGPPAQPPSSQNFIATPIGCAYRRIFECALVDAEVRAPKIVAEVESIQAAITLVSAGKGLSIVPRVVVEEDLRTGNVRELNWPSATQYADLMMVWRRRSVQPPGLRHLITSAEAHFSALDQALSALDV